LKRLISSDKQISKAWSEAWTVKSFRIQAIITLIVVLSFSLVFNRFFDFVEARQGELLQDYILELLPAYNVSWAVFFFLYTGIIFGLASHFAYPKVILLAFQTYILVTLCRIGTITLLPLEAPIGYLPLREPFVQLFTTGGKIISKDLFFSGHMSTILSVYFSINRSGPKAYLFVCSLMIGILLLVQHVHYTIDVIVAIPATFIIFHFCRRYVAGRAL
jgi:hypothetical protein